MKQAHGGNKLKDGCTNEGEDPISSNFHAGSICKCIYDILFIYIYKYILIPNLEKRITVCFKKRENHLTS